MSHTQLAHSPCGHLQPTIEGQQAYVPDPLPRSLVLSPPLVCRLDEASRAVANLAGVAETIPNPHLLIGPFVRREAVLSSKIEGTQASISDLFQYEATGTRRVSGDVTEVMNYVLALEHGIALLEKLPISVRLMNEIHAVLLKGVRGESTQPGLLRTEQVWIGPLNTPIKDARFIPPPAPLVRDLLLDLEHFVNEVAELPPLVQCGLLHYQFEAIHPYMDGNGRIGRLLIVLFLCARKVLPAPLLYLSAYFERDRDLYYDQLLRVSSTGDWETWLTYFLEGVADQAGDALRRTRRVRGLQKQYETLLQKDRASGNVFRLLDQLFVAPIITVPAAAAHLDVTSPGALGILGKLQRLGIVERQEEYWPHLYVVKELLSLIEAPDVE